MTRQALSRGGRGLVCAALLVATGACCAPAFAAKPPSKPLSFGLNDSTFIHAQDPGRILGLYSSLGANVQRTGVPWRSLEPSPGAFDWTYFDQVYRGAAARGIRTIAVISSVPAWASTRDLVRPCLFQPGAQACQRPPAPARLDAFANFVGRLALRYPRLLAIEVFNEPNMGNFNWQPRADPEYYARVLRVAHDASHAIRPRLPVISGGIGPLPFPVPAGALDPTEFLARMYEAGARGAMDGIGVHPYPGASAPFDRATSGYHRFMARMRAVRDSHGDSGLPLWVTETGYTTAGEIAVTEAQQSEWLAHLVGLSLRERDVKAVVVHTLVDRPAPSGGVAGGFGLRRPDLSAKPVFAKLAGVVRRAQKQAAAKALARSCRRARTRRAKRRLGCPRPKARKCSRAQRARRRCPRRTRRRARRSVTLGRTVPGARPARRTAPSPAPR